MANTSRLTLPLIGTNQSQKHVPHNEALAILDSLIMAAVVSTEQTSPPSVAHAGLSYIIPPSGATGAWAGYADYLTVYNGSGWTMYEPQDGWVAYDLANRRQVVFDDYRWAPMSSPTVISVADKGSEVANDVETLNFTGSGVSVAENSDGDIDIVIPGGISGFEVQDEGTLVQALATKLNFIGSGVSVSEASDGEIEISISGGGGGGGAIELAENGATVETAASRLNFTGAGVSLSENSDGDWDIVISGGGGGSALEIQDEGVQVQSDATTLNFVGGGVSVTEASDGEVEINISGGGEDPTQFVASLSTTPTNVTGDGTEYTVPFDTVDEAQSWASLSAGVVTISQTGLYFVHGSVRFEGGSAQDWAEGIILKNGSDVLRRGFEFTNEPVFIPDALAVVSLTAGDTIAFAGRVGGGALDMDVASSTTQLFLRIARLGVGVDRTGGRIVRIYPTSDETGVDASTVATVSMDTAETDVGGWWSAGTPDRVTVPAGVSYVNINARIRIDNLADNAFMRIEMNGAYLGGATVGNSNNRHRGDITFHNVPVNAGDYFELAVTTDTDTSIDFKSGIGNTYLAVSEVITGAGGSAIEVAENGATVDTAAHRLNFTGAGVTVAENSDGDLDIQIPSPDKDLLIGKEVPSNSVQGISLNRSGIIEATSNGTQCLGLNRKSSDGNIASFLQDGTTEGTISVSGATVSYNNFLGAHYSELDGDPEALLLGTVVVTAGDVCVDEGSGRLPKFKVASEQGTKSVYGTVLGPAWTLEEDKDVSLREEIRTKYRIAGVGAGWVRLKAGEAPELGDFIQQSDTPGCGEVQDDDILRSKTVGKITSLTVKETHPDGSFVLPCVMLAG